MDRAEAPVFRTPADPTPIPRATNGHHDLDRPEYYLNRELTWLNFNFRILQEAEDPGTPLLERLKFLAIVGSNLDKFFMKRIGRLKQQVEAGITGRTVDGRTPAEQIEQCYEVVDQLEARQRVLTHEIVAALAAEGIRVAGWAEVTAQQRKWLRELYVRSIHPLVLPQATDPAHPFPFISNLSLNLLVVLRYPGDRHSRLARVKVPVGVGVPRFVRIADSTVFVPLESVLTNNLDLLFPGMEVLSCEFFRVTRNAVHDVAEDLADDLLELIETGLLKRQLAPIVRLQVGREFDSGHLRMIAGMLGLKDVDVFHGDGLLGLSDLMELHDLPRPDLKDAPHLPSQHPGLLTARPIFHTIREDGPLLLHHPYHAFDTSVLRFLREAAHDPRVRAIKMTLYRVAPRSSFIDHLVHAVQNGKQVVVVIELRADEAANIRLANSLTSHGIHVAYGVLGLKTHCKVTLVVRQDDDGLRHYAHIGTGNYHAGTARLYCDHGILTCDSAIGADLTELFNYLTTGYRPKRTYGKLLSAPKFLGPALLKRIQREIKVHSEESPGHIQFQINALEDPEVTRALYRASARGVTVDLILRDSCRLRPGIAGLSENIRVVSIVGRFRQHSRIYYFRNGGDEEYYIGSADCMSRNFNARVEVLVPIQDPALRGELRHLLDIQLQDRRCAWEMGPDGSYTRRVPDSNSKTCTFETMIAWARAREFEGTRLRARLARGPRGQGWKE